MHDECNKFNTGVVSFDFCCSFAVEFSVFQVIIIKLSLVEMPVAELRVVALSADVLLTVALSVVDLQLSHH